MLKTATWRLADCQGAPGSNSCQKSPAPPWVGSLVETQTAGSAASAGSASNKELAQTSKDRARPKNVGLVASGFNDMSYPWLLIRN